MARWWAGIDWSNTMQDVVVIGDDGEVVKHLRVPESPDGAKEILTALRALHPTSHRFSRKHVPIAIEDGGRLLAVELRRRGQPIIVIPPTVSSRYRGRHGAAVSKSDRTDAALLADVIRQNPTRFRSMASNSDLAGAVAMLARAQADAAVQARVRMVQLQSHLARYYPAGAQAWAGMEYTLRRPEARAVLSLAPTPRQAAALTRRKIRDALEDAGRTRLLDAESDRLHQLFRQPQLRQDLLTEEAMGERTRAYLAMLDLACRQAADLADRADQTFSSHPHYEIYRSFPAAGPILAARIFAEIGDDPTRFATARNLRAYAGTAPITWSSGADHKVAHRQVCNRFLKTAVHQWAFGTLRRSPGARALYDARRERGDRFAAALRHVGNRLLSGLHHCTAADEMFREDVMFPS